MQSLRLTLLAAAGILALAACESDQKMAQTSTQMSSNTANYMAQLSAAQEVPPVNSQGRGDAQVTFDRSSKQLRWTVNYTGLSANATAAHFHQAAMGANGPVAINISPSGPPQSPMTGMATLSDAQAQALTAGQMYINIHTPANPGGEIRGQVVPR
jgi:hypothetical protein